MSLKRELVCFQRCPVLFNHIVKPLPFCQINSVNERGGGNNSPFRMQL